VENAVLPDSAHYFPDGLPSMDYQVNGEAKRSDLRESAVEGHLDSDLE
jgi:hypothetical protein